MAMSRLDIVNKKIAEGIIPRVAAVHDICGYGNCSLAVALPVVSAAGVDTLPVPTSVVSAQTNIEHYTIYDTTETLDAYIDSWKKIGFDLDGIYTGFLGSVEQIDLIKKLHNNYEDAFTVIDPVMGDHGKRYATYTDEMCTAMRELVPLADILMPNLTEASILLDRDYPGVNIDLDEAKEIAQALIDMGAKNVVLKGIEKDDCIANLILSETAETSLVKHKLHPIKLHGTGDLFASSVVAGIFSGHSLEESVEFAAKFVYEAIEVSTKQEGYLERGVNFESILDRVTDFCLK